MNTDATHPGDDYAPIFDVVGDNYVVPDDVVAAARELIRNEDGCVVFIGELLEELSGKFDDRFRVSLDMYKVVNLIETLNADPDVRQVTNEGFIQFAWDR